MSNLKYIKNCDINRREWDQCITESFNSRIYGLSWYLDIVCENWDGIVFGNYEYVFPVIFKKRFFFKKSYHPFFCQQLGFFLKNKNLINEKNFQLFNMFFLQYFKRYTFCATSEFSSLFPTKKINVNVKKNWYSNTNLELDLARNYNDIKDSYNQNTMRNLKKSKAYNLKIKKNLSINTFLELYKTNKKIKKSIQNIFSFSDNYLIIRNLIFACLKQKKGQLIGVFDEGNNIVSAAFFLSCFNRYIMLFNVTKSNFKEYHGMTYLIDNFIKSNSNQSKVLDFEGSNLYGVKKFYSGFGSVNRPYYLFQNFK